MRSLSLSPKPTRRFPAVLRQSPRSVAQPARSSGRPARRPARRRFARLPVRPDTTAASRMTWTPSTTRIPGSSGAPQRAWIGAWWFDHQPALRASGHDRRASHTVEIVDRQGTSAANRQRPPYRTRDPGCRHDLTASPWPSPSQSASPGELHRRTDPHLGTPVTAHDNGRPEEDAVVRARTGRSAGIRAHDEPGRHQPGRASGEKLLSVYVPSRSGKVQVIDPRTYKVVGRFHAAHQPQHVVPVLGHEDALGEQRHGQRAHAHRPAHRDAGPAVAVAGPLQPLLHPGRQARAGDGRAAAPDRRPQPAHDEAAAFAARCRAPASTTPTSPPT